MNVKSLELYKELYACDDFDFDLKQSGLLMLCKEEKSLIEEENLVKKAKELGLDARILNLDELKLLEPKASFDVLGGFVL